jgi:hypothetical protein
VGYIIVAVLLGVVLVGGLYGLQRYNAGNVQIAGNQDEKSQDKPKDEQPKSKDDAAKDNSSDKKTDEKPPVRTDSSDDTASSTDELPATGPESGLLTGLALASLTYAGTSLVRSRAHRWTSRGN